MDKLSASKTFEAVRDGAKDAILEGMQSITDMPGTDIFETIKEAVKEVAKKWFELHTGDIIKAISECQKRN